MPNVVMPNVIMPNVIMPNVVTLNVIMPNVVTLNVIMPNVVTPNVIAKCRYAECHYAKCHYTECLGAEKNDFLIGINSALTKNQRLKVLVVRNKKASARLHLANKFRSRTVLNEIKIEFFSIF